MDLLVALLGALAGVAAGGLLLGRVMERRLERLSGDLDRRLSALDQRLYLGLDSVQEAQHQAAGAVSEVRERFAVVESVAQRMLEQGRELARLQDLLRPPQARGQFGEARLEQLLADSLPPGTYRLQHAFRTGAVVDAALLVGGAIVPVDAKFPLDAFARMSELDEGDPGRALHRRAFIRAARQHVEAIASKYVRPEEGTYDFALCFIPSEAVHYELLREEAVFAEAVSRRVFFVSPTTLYAYLTALALGLRGLRLEANAKRVLDALDGLKGELERFGGDFRVLGDHLNHARKRWEDAARKLDRCGDRLADATDQVGELAERASAAGPLKGTG